MLVSAAIVVVLAVVVVVAGAAVAVLQSRLQTSTAPTIDSYVTTASDGLSFFRFSGQMLPGGASLRALCVSFSAFLSLTTLLSLACSPSPLAT